MIDTRVAELADEVAARAEALKDEINGASSQTPPYRNVYEVRRALEALEDEMRQGTGDAMGDAC